MDIKLKLLIGSSIIFLGLIFIAAFTGSYKLMALGFTQYIIVLVYVMAKTTLKNFSIVDFFSFAEEKANENFKNKKYLASTVYFVSIPMVVIGIIVIAINVIAMWFIF